MPDRNPTTVEEVYALIRRVSIERVSSSGDPDDRKFWVTEALSKAKARYGFFGDRTYIDYLDWVMFQHRREIDFSTPPSSKQLFDSYAL